MIHSREPAGIARERLRGVVDEDVDPAEARAQGRTERLHLSGEERRGTDRDRDCVEHKTSTSVEQLTRLRIFYGSHRIFDPVELDGSFLATTRGASRGGGASSRRAWRP